MLKIKVKKIGNHWYLNLLHDSADDIQFDDNIDTLLSKISNNGDILELYIYPVHSVLDTDTLIFNDSDLNKFYTTNEDFDIRFKIKNYEFTMSCSLYQMIQSQLSIDCLENYYVVKIWER